MRESVVGPRSSAGAIWRMSRDRISMMPESLEAGSPSCLGRLSGLPLPLARTGLIIGTSGLGAAMSGNDRRDTSLLGVSHVVHNRASATSAPSAACGMRRPCVRRSAHGRVRARPPNEDVASLPKGTGARPLGAYWRGTAARTYRGSERCQTGAPVCTMCGDERAHRPSAQDHPPALHRPAGRPLAC